MITSYALKKNGKLEFPDGGFRIITVSEIEAREIYCVLEKENSTCIQTKTFKRVGKEIKSGIDLGNCIRYVPPKKTLQFGDEIILPMGLKAEISDILGKTEDGGIVCLAYVSGSYTSSREVIYA